MTEKNLYLVAEGDVSEATPDTEWDGERSVVVLATDEADALDIASLWEKNLLQADNCIYDGQTVAAVFRGIDE
jgi:hypothetical protein